MLDVEKVFVKQGVETMQGFLVLDREFCEGCVVCVQGKNSSCQIVRKIVNCVNGGLQLQQESTVILFMLLECSGGEGNCTEGPILFFLHEVGT